MKRPPALDLDFADDNTGASISGVAVLMLGIAAAAFVVAAFHDTATRNTRLESELARAKKSGRAPALLAAGSKASSDAIQRATALANELGRRWDRVFLAIESAGSADVALLAIEPDPRRRLIRVTAEARNRNAMLAYVDRLQSGPVLRRVLLEQHEVRLQDAQRPVRFIVVASWEETQ